MKDPLAMPLITIRGWGWFWLYLPDALIEVDVRGYNESEREDLISPRNVDLNLEKLAKSLGENTIIKLEVLNQERTITLQKQKPNQPQCYPFWEETFTNFRAQTKPKGQP